MLNTAENVIADWYDAVEMRHVGGVRLPRETDGLDLIADLDCRREQEDAWTRFDAARVALEDRIRVALEQGDREEARTLMVRHYWLDDNYYMRDPWDW